MCTEHIIFLGAHAHLCTLILFDIYIYMHIYIFYVLWITFFTMYVHVYMCASFMCVKYANLIHD